MAWAIEQDVSSPAARCVLMSIANHVSMDGHGWVYQETIARESVMSVDTVQRRVPELIEGNFLRRIKLKRFGRRTHDFYILSRSGLFHAPLEEIRPLLPASCDVIEDAEPAPTGDETPENDSAVKEDSAPDATAKCGSGETSTLPHPAVDATALVRQQERILSQESERDARARGFKEDCRLTELKTKIWPTGIIDDQARIARAWGDRNDGERDKILKGAPVFLAELKKAGRKHVPALWKFIDDGSWDRLQAPANAANEVKSVVRPYDPKSREGLALERLAKMAAATLWRSNGKIMWSGEITPQMLTFADAPPDQLTHNIGSGEFRSYDDLFAKVFAGKARARLTSVRVPWQWPPRKDGSIITSGSGPLGESNLSKDDVDAFTG